MRNVLTCWVVLFLGCASVAVAADDDAIRTTTEFGITITADELTDAIDTTQQFWEPVLAYLGSNKFDEGESAVRKQTCDFFGEIHDGFYKQLFEGDEAAGQDLIDYLGLRLRKYTMYRRVREALANDVALLELVGFWEDAHRDIGALDQGERSLRVATLLQDVDARMKQLGVSNEARSKAMPHWKQMCECIERMNLTIAGKMMTDFDRKARKKDPPVLEMLRNVIIASDWATITSPQNEAPTLKQFKSAWTDLASERAKRTRLTVSSGG